jgi:two-component system chemotaxis sensor kinase CheA
MTPVKDPYRYFRIEARELLDGLQRGIATLDASPEDAGRVATLMRLAHTLKGAARVVRLRAISELAHRLEDILSPLRETANRITAAQGAALKELLGELARELAAIDAPPSAPGAAPAAPAASLSAAPAPAIADTFRLQTGEMDAVVSAMAEASTQLTSLRRELGAFDDLGRQARLLHALAARSERDETLLPRMRRDASDLATHVEGVRQRVFGRLDRFDRELQRLHEDTGRLRLVPTEALRTFVDRTIRDAAQAGGRRVRFEFQSRTPRLDTAVFGGLQEALLHVVRNAIAHGIEPEADRLAAGKPPEGCLNLELAAARGRLRVICRDDGRGIDVNAVREAARAKGWPEAATLASDDIAGAVNLLLRGGLTTTRTATEMSGRGVGLDSVRAAVTRLGGSLTITSTPGRGTQIAIELPVNMWAIDALAVECAGAEVLLPLEAVRVVQRAEIGAIRRVDAREELHGDDRVLPFAPLPRLLAGEAVGEDASRRHWPVLVLHAGPVALGVDRLLGVVEAVVRPLPPLADAAPFVAGAASGAGAAPRLVLDPAGLVTAVAASHAAPKPAAAARPPLLVVDDSLTTRMLEQSILESAGYTVDVAVSAEDGLKRLQERRYGLMLVDVEMPGMDGFTLIEHLRREPQWRDMPAILVTSREAPGDRERGFAVGAQDYVIKGEFDQRRLLRRIEELLQ